MAKRSEKNNWKKKRRQEYLEKKEFRYYIFCEGQATEPFYFQGFKQYIEDNPIYRDMKSYKQKYKKCARQDKGQYNRNTKPYS